MVITFSVILLGLIALVPPLQRNKFFILNSALIIALAYWIEGHWFRTSVFSYKTLLLLVVFQLVTINFTTFFSYWADKRAARKGAWRVSENNLHTLEFMGGWIGAYLAQKIFRHKSNKKSYQNMYKLMIVMEFAAIYFILKFLRLI